MKYYKGMLLRWRATGEAVVLAEGYQDYDTRTPIWRVLDSNKKLIGDRAEWDLEQETRPVWSGLEDTNSYYRPEKPL